MKNIKLFFLINLLVYPLAVFANGDDVIPSMLIVLSSIIVFLSLIIFLKLKLPERFTLFLVYAITFFLVGFFIKDIPFSKNKDWINFILIFVPATTFSITYLILRYNNKKILRNKSSIKKSISTSE